MATTACYLCSAVFTRPKPKHTLLLMFFSVALRLSESYRCAGTFVLEVCGGAGAIWGVSEVFGHSGATAGRAIALTLALTLSL